MRTITDEFKSRRVGKVTELLKREITDILQRHVKDPRLKNLTITEVFLKPDLRAAEVYVCKFLNVENPSEEEQLEIMRGLKAASHFVYEQLKRRLAMKSIPSIRFTYDLRMPELSKIWALTNPERNNEGEETVDEAGEEQASSKIASEKEDILL